MIKQISKVAKFLTNISFTIENKEGQIILSTKKKKKKKIKIIIIKNKRRFYMIIIRNL